MYFANISILLSLLCISTAIYAADSKKPTPLEPCTVYSPTSGSFFNLNSVAVRPLKDGKKAHKSDRIESWHAKGYDYGANFTLNFCEPVIEDLEDVIGINKEQAKNVSAYYTMGGKTYSIGQRSSEPVFRGRKLVLNYTMGSPCESTSSTYPRKLIDDDDGEKDSDDKDQKKPKSGSDSGRRKSTMISFLCDRDPTAPKASVSFVGQSPDECAYFFEVRSEAACGGANEAQQSIGPAGVFGVIVLVAAVVYLLGGIAYQRTVVHQRGWRQLPNYSIWAGIGNFVKDIFIILTSSCARLLPSRKGYNQLPTHNGGRDRSREDENRLIDQLDEDWDD